MKSLERIAEEIRYKIIKTSQISKIYIWHHHCLVLIL